jgi:hypothetical protein
MVDRLSALICSRLLRYDDGEVDLLLEAHLNDVPKRQKFSGYAE